MYCNVKYMLEDCKWLIGWDLVQTHKHSRTFSHNAFWVICKSLSPLKKRERMLIWLAWMSSEGKKRTKIPRCLQRDNFCWLLSCPFVSWTYCSVLGHNQILIRGLRKDWLQVWLRWLITGTLVFQDREALDQIDQLSLHSSVLFNTATYCHHWWTCRLTFWFIVEAVKCPSVKPTCPLKCLNQC